MRLSFVPYLLLCMAAFGLQGCPKEKVQQTCYLHNIVVYGGLRMSPAADSLPLGDTVWLGAARHRQGLDNNNTRVNLDGHGLGPRVQFARATISDGFNATDFKLVAETGSIADIRSTSRAYEATLLYALQGDSLRLRIGFVPGRKGIYQVSGVDGIITTDKINTAFYQSGACYEGMAYDSFVNPARHWYLAFPGFTQNGAGSYFVKIY